MYTCDIGLGGRHTGCATTETRGGGKNFAAKGGHAELDARKESGKDGVGRFAKASTANKQLASAPTTATATAQLAANGRRLQFATALYIHSSETTGSSALTVARVKPHCKFFPPAHPVDCGDARRAARIYAAGSGGGW